METLALQPHKGSSEIRICRVTTDTMQSFNPTRVRLKSTEAYDLAGYPLELQPHKGSSEISDIESRTSSLQASTPQGFV